MRETNWQGEMRRLEDAVRKCNGATVRPVPCDSVSRPEK
jgi:hypothetical protein